MKKSLTITCTKCKKQATVVWLIGNHNQVCFNCLYPHEQAMLRRDALRDDEFGQSVRDTLRSIKSDS